MIGQFTQLNGETPCNWKLYTLRPTSLCQTSNSWLNPTLSERISLCGFPRWGELSHSLSPLLPYGFHSFTRVPDKLKRHSCSLFLDSGVSESTGNLQAFSNPHKKIRIGSPYIKLYSACYLAWNVIHGLIPFMAPTSTFTSKRQHATKLSAGLQARSWFFASLKLQTFNFKGPWQFEHAGFPVSTSSRR